MSAQDIAAPTEFAAVVHTYTDVLRTLRDSGPLDVRAMATRTDRVLSNMRRDIPKLIEAGVILEGVETGLYALTDLGRQWVAGQDVAQGLATAGQRGEPGSPPADTDPRWPHQRSQILFLSHAQILPDPANARQDWDSEDARADLDALRQDILENGLLQNLVVTGPTTTGDWGITGPDGGVLPAYTLAGGERRWRAIGLAIAEDDWPATRTIPCRLLEADDMGVRIAALSENLQRRDLNPLEKALGFEGLAEAGLSNQDIADRFGKTPEHVQQHRRFLQLDEADQQRMTLSKDDPRRLGVKDARLKLAAKDKAEAPPPELPVSPMARLTLAEVMHAAVTRARYMYGDIEVSPDALKDIYLAELVSADEIKPVELETWGDAAGRYTVSLSYQVSWAAFSPDLRASGDDLDAGLKAEQDRALAFAGLPNTTTPEAPYLTRWLNGPFEITTEGQAVLDQIAQEKSEREEREAANIAARDAAIARGQAAADRARSLFATADAPPAEIATPAAFVEIATEAESRLPWRIAANGHAVDADGESVISPSNHPRSEARVRLMVLAMNAAAGLETPEDELPEPEQDIDGNDPEAEADDPEAESKD